MNTQVKYQDLTALVDRISVINQYLSTLDLNDPNLDQMIKEINLKINQIFSAKEI